jgi:hypothetical protein
MSETNEYRDQADRDVASIAPGDTPTEVESKVLGLGHISGLPDEAAKDADDAEDDSEVHGS